MLRDYSAGLSNAFSAGRCAIIAAEYTLADGRVTLLESVGNLT